MAYGVLEQRLADRAWLAGPRFSLAAYYERLLARPCVTRVLDEARPFFQFYPFREALPARFYQPEAA